MDTTQKPKASEMARGMILNVIGNFLLAWVFAHNIAAWTFVPDMDNMPQSSTIISSAVFTWLGFFVPVDLNAVAWERKSWKLFFINAGYHLAMLLVAAAILVSMG